MIRSSSFRFTGEFPDPEKAARVRAAIERHRPAMEAVLEQVRQYVKDTKETIDSISDPEERKRLRKEFLEP